MKAYIGFGISPDHLITAGLMSAPASLAISKTMFPETKIIKANFQNYKAKFAKFRFFYVLFQNYICLSLRKNFYRPI